MHHSDDEYYRDTLYTILCRNREGAPLTRPGSKRVWTHLDFAFNSAEEAKQAAQKWIDRGSKLEYAIGKIERSIVEVLP